MKKIILVLLMLIAVQVTAQQKFIKLDSLKEGDTINTYNLNASAEFVSLTLFGDSQADSVKVFHSVDNTYWSPVSLKQLDYWSVPVDMATSPATGTYKEYFVLVPYPVNLRLILTNASSTGRVQYYTISGRKY